MSGRRIAAAVLLGTVALFVGILGIVLAVDALGLPWWVSLILGGAFGYFVVGPLTAEILDPW